MRVLGFALLVAGCAAAQDTYARAAAREAVADVVETRFPGVPVTPVTDCIIDKASAAELVRIARDAADGRPGDASIRTVIDVAGATRHDPMPELRGAADADRLTMNRYDPRAVRPAGGKRQEDDTWSS